MTTTRKRRTRADRRAHLCRVCVPDVDGQLDDGTDHRTDQHDEWVARRADHDANVKWLRGKS